MREWLNILLGWAKVPWGQFCNHLPLVLDSAREQLEGNSSCSFIRSTPQLRSSLIQSGLCKGDVEWELFLKLQKISISNLSSSIWGFILILFSLLRWIQPSLLCTLRHNKTCHTRPPPQEAWPCWIYSMSSRTPASLCLFGPLTCSRKDLALLLIKVLCVNPCHLTTVSLSPASDRVYKVWFWFHHGNVITWIQCA